MHTTQLRQADLNLLVVFKVLAEERSVSRAAKRLSLTQPAMSRAMQRTRDLFQDDLLLRHNGAFHPTPLGQRLLAELEDILPRIDHLLSDSVFDPTREELTFRIASSDYGCSVLCEPLCRNHLTPESRVVFEFLPRNEDSFDALERGHIDLVLLIDDGVAPANLASEFLFEDELVCLVDRNLPFSGRFTLRDYMAQRHIGIYGSQASTARRLQKFGVRHCAVTVPYFTAAVSAVAGTNYVATVPLRIAEQEAKRPNHKILKAPREIFPFRYMMYWHPRMGRDASHIWLRATLKAAADSVTMQAESAPARRKTRSRKP